MNRQKGFVSIIVAAVLMILLSLVTIGFSRLMQREQRQALDRQLSTQAFYAAETGVNDVNAKLKSGTLTPEEKTTCDVSGDWNDGIVDPNTPEVVYTCLQYDRSPLDLVFTDTINTTSSKVFPVEADSAINKVVIEWSDEGSGNNLDASSTTACAGAATVPFPSSFSSGTVPVLRVDLIQVPAAFNRQNLIDNTASLYLYPKDCGTNTVTFANYIGASTGGVVEVDCSTTCKLTIDGLSENRYYARVKSIYRDVGTLRVTALDAADALLELKNAQTLVDSTGKANDVVRRIEVRIADAPNYRWPEAVVETSEGLCKLLQIAPSATTPTVGQSNCYN
jgi:Tfp pilus assembly protein PilX